MTELESVMTSLRENANPENVAGMRRYGINAEGTLGVSMPVMRHLARPYRRNQPLSLALWETGIHEARIMAGLTGDPRQVTSSQMDDWVIDLDSWDVCDQLCSNLFRYTPLAYAKSLEWSSRPEEFVKRAGFVLMVCQALPRIDTPPERLEEFLDIVRREAGDNRNFVKKAVNWALRQIGKHNRRFNRAALETANGLLESDSASTRWIAADAIRELKSAAVAARLRP